MPHQHGFYFRANQLKKKKVSYCDNIFSKFDQIRQSLLVVILEQTKTKTSQFTDHILITFIFLVHPAAQLSKYWVGTATRAGETEAGKFGHAPC
jgi:hypothetical protein